MRNEPQASAGAAPRGLKPAAQVRLTMDVQERGGEDREDTMNEQVTGWRRWLWPLRSRKVQVAVATVLAAYAAQIGVALSEDTVVTVLGVGVALILGIAHEDAGRRSREPQG
ncbi:MAG: hypothetical protein KKB50_04280 [Planctomycetes bacterium]|nr:hypothetical protein [Planctomycetota bacterium]